jgi:PEP-CTERM motif
MDLASRKGFLADSLTKLMKVFGGLMLLAVLAPHANASGMCLTAGGSGLYGGATLATAAFIAGCPVGLVSFGSGGAIITTSPNPLPSPISQLTTATLGYSDPSGTVNSASASLGLGTLGAFDSGSPTGGNNSSGPALIDVVHFNITDGATSVPIVVNLHLNGSESGGGSFDNLFRLTFGGDLSYEMTSNAGFIANTGSNWVGTPTLTNQTLSGFDFSGTINVTNGEALQLVMSLHLFCVNETCDFSHTAALSFTLPRDVTFTSDSGVLLTQTGGSAVPEPASFALMGAGLVALAVFRKRGDLSARFRLSSG